MSATITFDTFKFVERLEQAGLPRNQAAAFAEAQRDSLAEAMNAQLATKGDVTLLKTDLKSDIARLDYEIRLLKWMVGLSLALSVGILSMLTKIFFVLPQY
ncbi:MAG: hypothetical protein Q8O31_04430 [Rhodocyclaceae bacterium]|nr:hypothetical protein [Rhodocyclaceae bacterium]